MNLWQKTNVLILLVIASAASAFYVLPSKLELGAGFFVAGLIFTLLAARLKCGNCGYPILRDSNGVHMPFARKRCARCGADLNSIAADSSGSGSQGVDFDGNQPEIPKASMFDVFRREYIGNLLRIWAVLAALFLIFPMASMLTRPDGLTPIDLIAFIITSGMILVVLIFAWVLGSKLAKPKSK